MSETNLANQLGEMAVAGGKPFVDAKIREKKVMLFTKKYSPASKLSRKMLDTYGLTAKTYGVCEIESRQDCTQIENYFQIICQTDSRTVRIIVILYSHQKYFNTTD